MKLIYFNYLAYAEPIKMMMNHGNIPYEFIFPWDYFGTEKWSDSKKDVPLSTMLEHTTPETIYANPSIEVGTD